ncbi:hypothetical protein [Natrinema pallidum]|uniref:Uncharacterized protein n=2 Tax=Natrinema pallidum TaxID=69527 RepID=L9YR71_9EURY|nr:hypothetical protein [Natrinema pallidum]ELY75957.1 hypothetical protein C487_12668 [Natrinema pallidum DSM 3751]QCW02762.1 hypothetical protein FGF80_05725 [Natrinema pallidum]
MSVPARGVAVVSGSLVAVLTAPTGIGAALGGWIAASRTDGPNAGAVAGGTVGALAAIPWMTLVYLASTGMVGRIGYRSEWLRIGLTPAAPETLGPTQEVALTVLVGFGIVTAAVSGGFVAGRSTDGSDGGRRDPMRADSELSRTGDRSDRD